MEMTRQERELLKKTSFRAPLGRQIDVAEKPKILVAPHVVRKVAPLLRHVR